MGVLAYAFEGNVRGVFIGIFSLAVVVLFCMVVAWSTFKHLWDNNTPVSTTPGNTLVTLDEHISPDARRRLSIGEGYAFGPLRTRGL